MQLSDVANAMLDVQSRADFQILLGQVAEKKGSWHALFGFQGSERGPDGT